MYEKFVFIFVTNKGKNAVLNAQKVVLTHFGGFLAKPMSGYQIEFSILGFLLMFSLMFFTSKVLDSQSLMQNSEK